MKLTIPVPPSPNTWKRHPMMQHRQKQEYMGRVWIRAIAQAKPTRDPPERVVVRATLYAAKHMRDEDNLSGSLKWALDALKQKQTGAVNWRCQDGQALYDLCGYFLDDDPKHMTLEKPVQVKVKTLKEERLELEIG